MKPQATATKLGVGHSTAVYKWQADAQNIRRKGEGAKAKAKSSRGGFFPTVCVCLYLFPTSKVANSIFL